MKLRLVCLESRDLGYARAAHERRQRWLTLWLLVLLNIGLALVRWKLNQ